jgi:septal ring factor EnvC (AmiA/AmiB activator)
MEETIKEWLNSKVSNISEKIKQGKEPDWYETSLLLYFLMENDVKRTINEGISKLEGRIDSVEKKVEAVDNKVDVVKNELEKKIEEVNKKIEAVDNKVDVVKNELEKKIEEVNKKIEAVDNKVDTTKQCLEKKIEAVDNKVDTIKQYLEKKIVEGDSRLENEINKVRSDMGILAEEILVDKTVEKLEKEGEKVINVERGVETSLGEVDALIFTENKKVYVLEVKLKVDFNDVDVVKKKAEEIKRNYPDFQVIPAITGGRIGRKIKNYAKGSDVTVL